jgi:hypothetical protein
VPFCRNFNTALGKAQSAQSPQQEAHLQIPSEQLVRPGSGGKRTKSKATPVVRTTLQAGNRISPQFWNINPSATGDFTTSACHQDNPSDKNE